MTINSCVKFSFRRKNSMISQISGIKQKAFVYLFAVLLVVSSLTTLSTPAFADAKEGVIVTIYERINNLDWYGGQFRYDTGDWNPVIRDPKDCVVRPGQSMEILAIEKETNKQISYEIIPHSNDDAYICDKPGAIKRGYAATVNEIVSGNERHLEDVCTTVETVGQNKSRGLFTINEDADGLFVVFDNTGGEWNPVNDFPDTTGPVRVDFSQLP